MRWTAAALLLAVLASRALADGFDGQRFQPAIGAAGGLEVERPLVPQHLGFGLGLFLNYGYDPVVDRDRPAGVVRHPLHHELTADLLASIGLGGFFEFGIDLPVSPVYSGDLTLFNGARLNAQPGVGDLRAMPKLAWQFGRTRWNYGFGFAVPTTLPTGDENALRGTGAVTIDPELLFAFGGYRWNLGFNAGFRYRFDSGKRPDFTGGQELTFGAAGNFNVADGKVPVNLLLEVIGGYQPNNLFGGAIAVPLEGLGGVVIKVAREWSLYLGGGAGMSSGLGTPIFRGLVGVRYAHRVPGSRRFEDDDGDGIDNLHDQCPNDPEDFDGFEDDDGCPDADNDHDGVPDDDDECPDQAEERGGDGDGCPDHARVILRRGRITIFGKVHFETGSARIHKKSENLLDQVAEMIKEHPEVRRVEVDGHTDNVGPAELNLRLSRERAESVRVALLQRGVPKSRLHNQGFGETRPVAPNRTRAGRAKNRRVEFVVLAR